MTRDKPTNKPQKAGPRGHRLKAALKANLARRKTQARVRAAQDKPPKEPVDEQDRDD